MKLQRTICFSVCLLTISSACAGQKAAPAAERRVALDLKEKQKYPWRFHRFNVIDYTITGLAGAGFLWVQFGVDPPKRAKWTSTIGVDNDFRRWLAASTLVGRERADKYSDVFWYAAMALPFAELLFPLAGDNGNVDTAWQMAQINFEAFAISGFLSRAGHRLVARQRPDVNECRKDSNYNGDHCFAGSYASFPSGHTSSASVGAGLICAHHIKLGLLENDVADGLACGAAASMAVGTGVLRMIADRHNVTDVAAGMVIGFGSGLLLPLLHHYRKEESEKSAATGVKWTVIPTAQGNDSWGVTAFGWF